VSQTKELLIQDLSKVLWLFSCFGFMAGTEKTTVLPSTELEFLGFSLNTKTMTVALPTAKNEEHSVRCVQDPAEQDNCLEDAL